MRVTCTKCGGSGGEYTIRGEWAPCEECRGSGSIYHPQVGERVFHRRLDLFGMVIAIDYRLDEDRASVKYEWPYDPNADPEIVSVKELSEPPIL